MIMTTRILVMCIMGWLIASTPVWSAETGTARKTSELKKTPFRDAPTVGALAAGDTVLILEKRGGWYRVKRGKHGGWVRMLSIRRGQARTTVAAGDAVALASGRAGTGRVVASTGIRGLSEEELRLARYDEAAVRALEAYAISRTDALQFAQRGGLTARVLE